MPLFNKLTAVKKIVHAIQMFMQTPGVEWRSCDSVLATVTENRAEPGDLDPQQK
jgi:hypothetical protein